MARILLIVDDRADVARAYRRYFQRYFDVVHVAATVAEAEEVLGGAEPPTHIVCDYWLGEGEVVGTALIARWRARYPSVMRAVLVSGSELSAIVDAPGVDAIIDKPVDPARIRAALDVVAR